MPRLAFVINKKLLKSALLNSPPPLSIYTKPNIQLLCFQVYDVLQLPYKGCKIRNRCIAHVNMQEKT